MADEVKPGTAPAAPPTAPVAPAKPAPTDEQRKARKAAKKELRAMHAVNRQDPKHDPKTFDEKRYHALHYLAAGQPVPSTDPDDLD